MQALSGDEGSFRDPSGRVFKQGGRIFRTVAEAGRKNYEAARDAGVLEKQIAAGRLVGSVELPPQSWPAHPAGARYLLEHEPLQFISYPYEWPFRALKAAALLHLELHLALLEDGFTLSDASAYNVQFRGAQPVFIDTLSIRKYRKGEYWTAHRQFCEQFLNPLLLQALKGVPYNSWFRGALEGIAVGDLARLLTWREKASWNVLAHVVLQDRLEQKSLKDPGKAIAQVHQGHALSLTGYKAILLQLKRWISKLEPAGNETTAWGDYAASNTYADAEATHKRQAIRDFATATKPDTLIDLGCNSGDFSVSALDGGAKKVIGFDFDHRAIDLAFSRATSEKLDFLPLWLDAANPSPDQGWNQAERKGFASRAKADAVIALAFEHHLAIGRNVPLPDVVRWLVDVAPTGILEFVPKSDPTIRTMLALREDIFPHYDEAAFEKALAENARITGKSTITESGRVLFTFDRRP